MSSKKIYNTIGLSSEVWAAVSKLGREHQRSKSFIIEKFLRKVLRMQPDGEWIGDGYANKS